MKLETLLRHLCLLAVLTFATLAVATPAAASQCPLFPDWCSCNYCFKNQNCNCRLREGDNNYPCSSYLMYGGCGGGLLAEQPEQDQAALPAVTEDEGEVRLEDLLRASESAEACE